MNSHSVYVNRQLRKEAARRDAESVKYAPRDLRDVSISKADSGDYSLHFTGSRACCGNGDCTVFWATRRETCPITDTFRGVYITVIGERDRRWETSLRKAIEWVSNDIVAGHYPGGDDIVAALSFVAGIDD